MPLASGAHVKFTNELARTKSAENRVIEESKKLPATKNANQALVRCVPKSKGGESWHKGGTNPKEPLHITVEFMKDGKHVTTKHIYRY